MNTDPSLCKQETENMHSFLVDGATTSIDHAFSHKKLNKTS